MNVLCDRLADRSSDSDIATMLDRYRALDPAPEHVVFQSRLGLVVIDLAAGDPTVPEISDAIVHDALEAADAYAARDALSHQACHSHTAADDERTLAETVRSAGLGCGTIAPHLLEALMEAVRSSEASMADALDSEGIGSW